MKPDEWFNFVLTTDRLFAIEWFLSTHDVNAKTDDGTILVCAAAERGETAKVRMLLEWGADPDMQNRLGFNALMAAIMNSHWDVVRVLLDYGADVNAVGAPRCSSNVHTDGSCMLMYGISVFDLWYEDNGGLEELTRLVNAGLDIDYVLGKYGHMRETRDHLLTIQWDRWQKSVAPTVPLLLPSLVGLVLDYTRPLPAV